MTRYGTKILGLAGCGLSVFVAVTAFRPNQSGYLSERRGYAEGCKQANSSISPDRVNPHWTPVGRSDQPVEIRKGVVVDAYITHTDFPLDHNSHDFCFKIHDPDINHLISDANENYGALDEDEKAEGVTQPKVIECEWESAEFPELFWPQAEDEVLFVVGRHVWDCGHPPLKTEIHPPQAVAFARPDIHVMSGSNYPSFGKKALVYIHGGGGYYKANSAKRNYSFDLEVPLYGTVANFKKRLQDVDLKVEFQLPYGGPQPKVTTKIKLDTERAVIHVEIPLANVDDPDGTFKYGLILRAGWLEKVPSLTYRKLRYTFDTLTLFEDHDPGLRGDGEWNLWTYAAGSYIRFSGLSDIGDDEKGHSHWLRKSAEVIVQQRDVLPWSNVSGLRNLAEELVIWPAPLNRIRTTGWEDDCDSFFGIKKFDAGAASKFLETTWNVADILGTVIASENDRLGVVSDFRQDVEGTAPPVGQKLLSQVLGANAYRSIKPFGVGENKASDDTNGDFTLNFRVESIHTFLPAQGVKRQLRTLVIDKIIMHKTPQSGTWLFAFQAEAQGTTARFHIPDREYEHDPTDILLRLRLQNHAVGQPVTFKVFLDDDEDSVNFTSDAEDRSSGLFTSSDFGQQTFRGGADWEYTVFWHMEE